MHWLMKRSSGRRALVLNLITHGRPVRSLGVTRYTQVRHAEMGSGTRYTQGRHCYTRPQPWAALPSAGVRALVKVPLLGWESGLINLRVAHGLLTQVTLLLASRMPNVVTVLLM